MARLLFILSLFALAGIACGPPMPDENPSCCFYQCNGPRETFFAEYFGSEASCTELAEGRCLNQFPENPGLQRIEYQGGIEIAEDPDLGRICEQRFENFRSATSTSS